LNYEYGIANALASCLGSIVGNLVKNKLINDKKYLSVLIYILGIVLGLSAIFLPLNIFINIINDIKKGKNIMKFNSPC
jgi:hypothetical protein